MKALGKCLICRGIIAKEEIPPERAKIYLSLTEIFITYLSGKELLEKSQLLSHRLFSAVFPFCKQCRKIVATLHRNHFQIQTGLRRIQQIIGKSRAQRSCFDCRNNKITSCTEAKDTSIEFSEPSRDRSEAFHFRLQDTTSACNSHVKTANGVELLGSDPYQSSNHGTDSDFAVESSDGSHKEYITSKPSTPSTEGESKPSVPVELPTVSSESRMTYAMKRQQSNLLLLEPGVRAVTSRDLLTWTGPDTFAYLDKFGIEKAQDRYRCSTCGYIGRTRGEVCHHIRMVHAPPIPHRRNIRLVEKSPNMWYYAEFAAEKVEDEYRCLSCTHVSIRRERLAAHLRNQHYVRAHPEVKARNSFVCEICGKICATAFRLKMHQHVHDDKPNFTCKDCGERFNTWGKLTLHTRKHLGEEGKKFICEYCGRKFWQQIYLRNHLFSHTGQREFICKTCGKSYATNTGLRLHLDSHTGNKYFCDLCDMEFTQPYSVVRHKKTAHDVRVVPTRQRKQATNEKP